MKLVSFRASGPGIRVGAVLDERVVVDLTDLIAGLGFPEETGAALAERGLAPPLGVLRLLHLGPAATAAVARHLTTFAGREDMAGTYTLDEVTLLAPVPRPGKIVGVGRNYADHAKETGIDPFETPRIIAKLTSSVVGPGAVVRRPSGVQKMDFEAELGVVIGAFTREVPRERALDFVAGYTILNDVSAREFQFDVSPPQTTFAKSMDGFCPMGPWVVTADEIRDPQTLELACFVNGEPMQHGRTADMLFPVDRLIEYLSGFMTLEPGDVIATGTPSGIGAFRDPPVWLKPGDRVRMEISGIGALEHDIG